MLLSILIVSTLIVKMESYCRKSVHVCISFLFIDICINFLLCLCIALMYDASISCEKKCMQVKTILATILPLSPYVLKYISLFFLSFWLFLSWSNKGIHLTKKIKINFASFTSIIQQFFHATKEFFYHFLYLTYSCDFISEIVRAMNYVISKGWVMYWGTSRWTPVEIMEAYTNCRQFNCVTPIVEQAEYHLFYREKPELYMPELYNKIGN